MSTRDDGTVRNFETGATRDTTEGKFDYEGFLSPLVLEQYASYMHNNRRQSDGTFRDSDNWQKGIPLNVYMKSLWRHFMMMWTRHRGSGKPAYDDLCGILFNTMGYMHEMISAEIGEHELLAVLDEAPPLLVQNPVRPLPPEAIQVGPGHSL